MLILTFQVNNVSGHIPEIKEALAVILEKWGDVKLLEVREVQTLPPEQTRISGT